jgi:hypothetical protein
MLSSKVSRVVIYITLTKKQGSYFGNSLLQWMFKGGGWKPRESKVSKRLAQDDKTRLMLMNVLRDMIKGIYTDEVERYFKKIGLPIQFHVDKISQSHVGWDQPEELIVSGSGNPTNLTRWLEQKQIKYEVRNVTIQQQ